MIHLCAIRRGGKWVITTSDLVTPEEAVDTALYKARPVIKKCLLAPSPFRVYFKKGGKQND